MASNTRLIVLLLGAVIGARVVAMYLVPFIDTSEPRYAEIARLMIETDNWVTPWFSPGVPFWGKPPLSFWAQAASFRLFGVNEIAGRLPSLMVASATIALAFAYLRTVRDLASAQLTAWILATSLLAFVGAGAVLTDPFLALGTTLSMVSFRLAVLNQSQSWGYGFFLGIVIGLLAKGPLAAVLIVGPILIWLCLSRMHWSSLRSLPWLRGGLLTALLVLPWYGMAEIRTPGFLQYFIIGEHLLRFLEPGWQGDLYGSAHLKPFGAIWWNWGVAAFPWSLVLLVALLESVFRRSTFADIPMLVRDDEVKYMASWAVFPMFFFSFAHNILWTYVLPGLPAFAMLSALYIRRRGWSIKNKGVVVAGALVPLVCLVLTGVVSDWPDRVKSERSLIRYAQSRGAGTDARLIYVDAMPFSARFYSAGKAEQVALRDLFAILASSDQPVNVAVPKLVFKEFTRMIPSGWKLAYENKRYFLVVVSTADIPESSSRVVHLIARAV